MSNPYEDEDAINPSIEMSLNEYYDEDASTPPFLKVFKQVGDTFRNGGFCNAPKQQHTGTSTVSNNDKAVTSEADEALDSNVNVNVNDEVGADVVETDSDGEDSSQEKVKSVTFNDLAEPLIVPEEEETTAKATSTSTIASSSNSRSAAAATANTSFAISTSIVAILIAVLGSISFIQPQLLLELANNLMESKPVAQLMESEYVSKVSTFMASEQVHLITDQIKAVTHMCDDCPMTRMAGTAFLVALSAIVVGRTKGIAQKFTVVGCVEFLWGAMICGMIASGVYYIYNR